MNISESIKTLDGVIPSPDNKMVDFEHFPIAVAWKEVKAEIERLEAENANLTVENEVLQSEKENLMRTLEEGGEEIESARKETAKEILQILYNNIERKQFFETYIKTLARKYGVEVEE